MTLRVLACCLSAAAALTIVSCGHHHSPLAPSDLRVSAVTPAQGSSFGGIGVTVHGDGFAPGVAVSFGGVPGTAVVVLDAQNLTVVTPAHVVGVVPVVVVLDGRSAGLANSYTYGAPAVGDNPPPVIQSITSTGPHANQPDRYAEVSEPLSLTATVVDNETSSDALQYDWSAPDGTFGGAGATVTWQPPVKPTPFDIIITLTVTEHFKTPDSHGLPVDQTNVVTGTIDVFVHDAKKEVNSEGANFLELFSDSNKGPDQVLQDFDPGCLDMGDSERTDVINNRRDFKIISHDIGTPTFTLNFGGFCTLIGEGKSRPGDACAYFPSHWLSLLTADPTAPAEPSDGVDQVAALYRNNRWVLCTSEFVMSASSQRNIMKR